MTIGAAWLKKSGLNRLCPSAITDWQESRMNHEHIVKSIPDQRRFCIRIVFIILIDQWPF
jgi:hypothetical protein